MNKMRLNDALQYLNYSVKEGTIDEETAQDLMDLPWKEFVNVVDEMRAKGDMYANDNERQNV